MKKLSDTLEPEIYEIYELNNGDIVKCILTFNCSCDGCCLHLNTEQKIGCGKIRCTAGRRSDNNDIKLYLVTNLAMLK